MSRKSTRPVARVAAGEQFPDLQLTAINGDSVAVPDPAGAWTHLQFRRFAGCPICNLHLASISAHLGDISAAGIREVVVFHSTPAELRKYQDDMPFAVIGDPDRTLYRRFGVEASAKAVLKLAEDALVSALTGRRSSSSSDAIGLETPVTALADQHLSRLAEDGRSPVTLATYRFALGKLQKFICGVRVGEASPARS
jgi:peroxiredoxin